jgi:methylenetetrahydrofolate--tRNA-(uracil-5-)-methyltransferase
MAAPSITVIGGGLAGSEAAWQLLRCGISVDLVEARPAVQSPAHRSLLLAEMVCSNSLRSDSAETGPGLLKNEMRAIGSLLLEQAERHQVPAGSALAVDRWNFAWGVSSALIMHPRLRIRRYALDRIPEGNVILATGPLTSAGMTQLLKRTLGQGMYFYDAIAPIVEGDSIDYDRVFFGARREPDSRDYINCPMDRQQYDALVMALREADRVPAHPFEQEHYFEGCLPVEVMAGRGNDALSYGPLRPIGLIDPRTGRRPHAVIQLRKEDDAGRRYNLVGFQTRMTYGEQRRVLSMIPGLEKARFERLGSIHRNSFLDSPNLLDSSLRLKCSPNVRVAGQFSGVEGYLESGALGQLVGLLAAAELRGMDLSPPPPSTALGALVRHVTRPRGKGERFEPSNITFGLLPAPTERIRNKRERRRFVAESALDELKVWAQQLQPLFVDG